MTTEEKINEASSKYNELRSLCAQIDIERTQAHSGAGAVAPWSPLDPAYDHIRMGDGPRLIKQLEAARKWREAYERVSPEDREILFGVS